MDIFVARQPIFNRKQRVYAYELLYRNSNINSYTETDGDKASLGVIIDGIHGIGLQTLSFGKKAFINITGNLLAKEIATILPKDQVVIEILESVLPDDNIVDKCRELKRIGYTIALDDFVAEHEFGKLVDYADIIKVDFLGTTHNQRKNIIKQHSAKNIKFLAEKVETKEEFDEAYKMGFSLFQGYFFSKPVIIQGKDISPMKMNYLELLNLLNAEEPDFARIAKVVERDVSLSYKLLRLINSAAFGFRQKVTSLKQAIATLGINECKKWAAVLALKDLGSDNNEEIVHASILRAKMMESLAYSIGKGEAASELFLVGLFSMIDVLLNKPMEEIVILMPFSDRVKEALLDPSCQFCIIRKLVTSYERGEWDITLMYADHLEIKPAEIVKAYRNAVNWGKMMED